jgi:hypothetical protein
MLRHAEPVVDRPVAAGGIEPRRRAQLLGRNAGQHLGHLGRMADVRDELGIILELVPVAAFADERLVESFSVTITWASAVTTATLVPGRSGR